MTKRKCKACNADLFFVTSKETGRIIPLQQVQAYELEETRTQGNGQYETKIDYEAIKFTGARIFISHFMTCTKPNDFSKK